MTCLYILRVPQNKSVSPLRGSICKSFHLANIYRAPTVCWVQKDVGATRRQGNAGVPSCLLFPGNQMAMGRGKREVRPHLNGETISFFHPLFLLLFSSLFISSLYLFIFHVSLTPSSHAFFLFLLLR